MYHPLPRRPALAHRAGALLALTLASACSDGTAPPPRLTVTAALVATPQVSVLDATPTTPPMVRCAPQVRLTAAGEGRSLFGETTIYRYTGATRSSPTDSTRIAAALVQQAFAASAILPEASLTAVWVLEDTLPFTARFVIRHRVEGRSAEESVEVVAACGPIPSATTPAPEISNVSTTLPAGDFEPGDSLVLRYDVTAPMGLWRTATRISGPCDVAASSAERLQTSAQLSVTLAIPRTCRLGVPIQLHVVASDGAGRADTSVVSTTLTLVDRTPPTLQYGGDVSGSFFPIAFAGDSLNLILIEQDNVLVKWLTVGAGASGAVDSIDVTTWPAGGPVRRIAVRNSWAGAPYLRLRAFDAAGNASAEVRTDSGKISFHPSVTRTSTGVTIPGEARQIVVDRQGRTHVMQSNESRITTLERGTLATLATTNIPEARPSQLAPTPGGDTLVMLQFQRNTFRLVDVRGTTPAVGPAVTIQGLDDARGDAPGGIVVTARNTAFLIVTSATVGNWRLVELDLATGATTPRDAGVSGDALVGASMVRSGDGQTVLLTTTTWNGSANVPCTRRWTLATDVFSSCQSLPAGDGVPQYVDRTGTRSASFRRIFDGTLAASWPIGLVANDNAAYIMAMAPDGTTLYAVRGSGFVRIRASDGATLDLLAGTASLDGRFAEHAQISPDGSVIVWSSGGAASTSRVMTMPLP